MNGIGASILIVLIVAVLAAPRRIAMLGMLSGVLYLTQAQQVQFIGLNMYAVRFLELAGFLRVIARREFSFSSMNRIDKGLLVLYTYSTMIYLLRSKEGQAYAIGIMVDAFLCYFTFRGLCLDFEDYEGLLVSFIFLLAPYTLLVLIESKTMHNPFAILGGVDYGWVRNGRPRCMGSFRNPDLLGTLGTSFLALYLGLFCVKERRMLASIGIALCLAIIWACNAGGPVSATALVVVGWVLWLLRGRMFLVRRGLVLIIVLAAIFMKAPVWYLIAKVSQITGGDGWHRSYLMDISFQNLGKWWFVGMPMIETKDWFGYGFDGGADITNQFLSYGLNAGLAALVLFIVLLTRAYKGLGAALAAVRAHSPEPGKTEFLLWGLGVMLAAHIITWLGITYFDQSSVLWFMELAVIAGVSQQCASEPSGVSEVLMAKDEEELLRPETQSAQAG